MIDFLLHIIEYLISIIDKGDYNDKLIKSFNISGVEVLTDTGFHNASHIHLTKPFDIYAIYTKNGLSLECADNHIVFDQYFNEVFVKDLYIGQNILTEYGIDEIVDIKHSNIKLSMCDISIDSSNHRYFTNHILSHNTTTSAIFLLHYILFNTDKNALVLGNKRKTAVEILDKIKKIYLELPYYLKPGIYKWNEGEIVFDNGCRIMCEATTINSGISFTFHCVLADEFAHIAPNIKDAFYNNLFPVITAGRARFMITSTQNGYDLFYRLYTAAVAKENEYAAFKVDWYQVPEWNPDKRCWEKRDEVWHKLQVANYGSEEAFNKQFGTSFDVSSNTLIDNKIMKRFESDSIEFVNKELPGVMCSESFFWHPDYDLENLKNDYFVITIDIAEGIGADYTVYTLNKLIYTGDADSAVNTETIGFFKNNTLNAEQSTTVLQQFCSNYLNINKYLISLEYNLYGELFAKYILENIEKNPNNVERFNEDIIMKYWNDEMTKYTLGKKITSKSKLLGISLFKNAFERSKIINRSTQFLNELNNFCDKNGNGTYAASFGHDDLVMSQLQMAFVIENPQYKYLCQEFISSKDIKEPQNDFNIYTDNNYYNTPYKDMYSIYTNVYDDANSSNISRIKLYN